MVSFRSTAAVFGLVAAAQAENILRFVSTDSTDRTIYVTPNAGVEGVDPVSVAAGATVDVTLCESFIGNAYSISSGADNVPGMLAEVNFQGWNGYTYFDVSAIVDAADHDGVHMMYPAEAQTPTSGCETFPCNNAYYLADDVQTKTTTETVIIVTLGSGSNSTTAKRSDEGEAVARSLVLGEM